MADIVFKYPEMRKAVEDIAQLAEDYRKAANTFESDFNSAVSNWEGDSKDKLQQFIQGPVMEYMRDTVGSLVDGLSELLSQNADIMEKADQQIAENIPTTLG